MAKQRCQISCPMLVSPGHQQPYHWLYEIGRFSYSVHNLHNDVIKWKHFPPYWPFVRGIHQSQVNSPHKGQWRRALTFSLICAWINGWVNNCEAGDLRWNHVHFGVTVMSVKEWCKCKYHCIFLKTVCYGECQQDVIGNWSSYNGTLLYITSPNMGTDPAFNDKTILTSSGSFKQINAFFCFNSLNPSDAYMRR